MNTRTVIQSGLHIIFAIAATIGVFLVLGIVVTVLEFAFDVTLAAMRRVFWFGLPLGFAWALYAALKRNVSFWDTIGEVYLGVGATFCALYVIGGSLALIPSSDVWMLLMIGLAWFGPAALVIGIVERIKDRFPSRG